MYFLGYIGYIYDTDMDYIPYTAIMLLEGCFFMCQGNGCFLLYKYMVTKSRKMLNNRSFCGFIGKVNSGKEAYA